ncbi:patatin-like phospholipase family protein [Lawsonibacter celer]|jgi:predicted patatin/cPLA2 family phospholipase|uniref:patatin-like phospholipase family protein n=1 Tax=Lawsonibacter celer TaxID=2986526 RepID=UPI001646C74F|nr:patatin family protein [Lawsonibacter celer]
MNGIIDVGGGMRGVYTAGVYDYLLDHQIRFDYCIGVSAGSANMMSYLAGQRGRNKRFYVDYAGRRDYMSWSNFLRKGSYLDLDYIYSALSNSDGEDPVDYEAFLASPAQYVVVATNGLTGAPHYFTKSDTRKDGYEIVKASCALPIACKPYEIDGIPYFDGGVADPVPYRKALSDGCDRIVVLLTRPRDFVRGPQKPMRVAQRALRRYPKALESLKQRHIRYNEAVSELKRLEAEGKALLLAPADIDGMSTLTRNEMAMERLYGYGYQDAAKIAGFLESSNERES